VQPRQGIKKVNFRRRRIRALRHRRKPRRKGIREIKTADANYRVNNRRANGYEPKVFGAAPELDAGLPRKTSDMELAFQFSSAPTKLRPCDPLIN
jgi:hypothetical protein